MDCLYLPCMTDANTMVHITQDEFEELVCKDASCISESKEGVIRKHCS